MSRSRGIHTPRTALTMSATHKETSSSHPVSRRDAIGIGALTACGLGFPDQLDAETAPATNAAWEMPAFASRNDADLWEKLYRVIRMIRQSALDNTGRERGSEYATSLFMCTTEEISIQHDPRQLVMLMGLALALGRVLDPQ